MLDQIINQKMKELVERGEIDKIVEDNLIKTLNNIVESSLRSYSDVGKALEKKLGETMLAGVDKLDFTIYRDTVISIIQKTLNETSATYAVAPVTDAINKFMDVIEKKEWQLSEIIGKFIEDIIEDADIHDEGQISLVVKDSSNSSVWIGFDKESGKDQDWNCKYRISIDKKSGRLWYFSIDDEPVNPLKTSSIYGFDEFLFKLYANRVIVNIDSPETSWSTYD